jgi:hypothetical protein
VDAFARTVEAAARLADREVRVIHLVGAQNPLLCQATANRTGLLVIAGPVEATAIGNILVQARASGLIFGDLPQLRSIVAGGLELTAYDRLRQSRALTRLLDSFPCDEAVVKGRRFHQRSRAVQPALQFSHKTPDQAFHVYPDAGQCGRPELPGGNGVYAYD